jgi:hypothetical protein
VEGEKKMSRRERVYYVGIGGSPMDTWKEYYCYFDAVDACWELAEEMAEEKGIHLENLSQWGCDDPCVGAGVCPVGDNGGYWPNVFIKFK